MANNVFIENGDIGRSSSDVDQTNTCLFFFLTQYRKGARKGFEDQLLGGELCTLDARVDVDNGCSLGGDDMEICLQTVAGHPYRIFDASLIINRIVLRHHVNDTIPWRNDNVVHVCSQSLHIFNSDFILRRLTHDASMHDFTLNVLSSNSYNHFCNVHLGHVGTFFHSLYDSIYSFVDIGDYPSLYPIRHRLAHAKDF